MSHLIWIRNFLLFNPWLQIEMWLRQESRKVPLRTYAFLALTTVATMGFSNASLGYLNYPTQVIASFVRFVLLYLNSIFVGALIVVSLL